MPKYCYTLVLLALLLVSPALGQVDIKSGTYLKLDGATSVKTVGDHVLVPTSSQVVFKPVGIVIVTTVAANVEVAVTDETRTPVEVEEIDKNVFCLEKPGKYWVDVTVIDFDKNIYSRKQIVVTVGTVPPTPTPPGPGPGPAPSPNGPFEGLAAKVRNVSVSMQPDAKFSLANVFETAAAKLASREFLQLSQAANYINTNSPQCTPATGCKPVYDFLATDARSRVLSINSAVEYYREIAKGLR